MSKEVYPYKDCPLQITHKTGLDLASATSLSCICEKPSGVKVTRSGMRVGTTDVVTAGFTSDDIDESGLCQFQFIINYSGVERGCRIQTQMIYDRL